MYPANDNCDNTNDSYNHLGTSRVLIQESASRIVTIFQIPGFCR